MGKKIIKKGKKPNETETIIYDNITKIETDILLKIQKLKRLPKLTFCQHMRIQNQNPQPFDPNFNYFDQFWKSFLRNELAKGQIAKLYQQIVYLSKRLSKIESLFQQRRQQIEPYQKYRSRQQKAQSLSKYPCNLCDRSYNDKDTLIFHQQIKHLQGKAAQQKQPNDQDIYEQEENSEEDY